MCFFVPRTVFQRILNDETASPEARAAAQQQIDAITNTLKAIDKASSSAQKVKTRYDEIPSGFTEFSSKIWGMATHNIEEIDYDTGEILGTSYKPLPGILYTSSQDPPYTQDPDVVACMEGLRTTYDFYKTVFKRNSIDDNGLQLEASIHYSIRYGNAVWESESRQMIFGDGDGNTRFGRFKGMFKPGSMVNSLDVIAHELTHGVIQHTADLKYEFQSGALNESIADVFGCMVSQWKKQQKVEAADWLMGANIIYENSEDLGASSIANCLRSLKDPSAATNFSPQPDHMKHDLFHNGDDVSDDNGGVHTNSGVPNFAFYKIAMALGGYSWERAGQIWYNTITDKRIHPKTQFEEFAKVTVDVARKLYGNDLSVADVVEKAWKDVGVLQ